MTKMDTPLPDVDELDNEVEFETAYRTLRHELLPLFEDGDNVTIHLITSVAHKVIGHYHKIDEVVIATLKALLRDKVIRKVDRDSFCDHNIGPRLRSIDDRFADYVFSQPEDKPRPPSKKEIMLDVARVARKLQGTSPLPQLFTMGELAKAWTKDTTPRMINGMQQAFSISTEIKTNGKRIFMAVVEMLVNEGIITPAGFGDQYKVVPPKKERFRSLDDDWC